MVGPNEILKKYFGYDSFRRGQKEIIDDVLNGKDVLAIMPTGAGKSICFQVPAMLFEGITLVISPLISLMKDQVDSLTNLGIQATYINSTLSDIEFRQRLTNIVDGKYNLVYIAPERLESSSFCSILNDIEVSFVAIDEAHCVSQWAHDFRPSYKKVSSFIKRLRKRPIIGAYTATATEKVEEDIIDLLDLNVQKAYTTGFDRENLFFSVLRGENREKFILEYLKKHKGNTGIIYTATRKEGEKIYNILNEKGIKAGLYHGGLSDKQREEQQNKFAYDDIDVMVATNAFGMGIDKSNVRFVIHNNIPKNIEAYYQEAGRAGRDGEKSECILLFAPKDIQLQTFFIEEGNLPQDRKVYEYEKLRSMVDYCYTSKCLRKYILEYFGEKVEYEGCQDCGNCKDESEINDITLEAKKIFSCVYRMKERYGSGVVADVLKGSQNKKVMDSRLNNLSTYGIMRECPRKDIVDVINKLAADGYLRLTNDGYPVLKLTNKAIHVLKDDHKVLMKTARVKRRIDTDNELLETLKLLRKDIAIRENVPPYIVFADSSLKEMSMYLPSHKDEFLNIKGVGEVKYERYGEEFLDSIREYIEEKGIDKQTVLSKSTSDNNTKDTRVEEKVPSYELTYDLYSKGKTLEEIAKERDMILRTVQDHIVKCVMEGKEININDFVPQNYVDMIKDAIEKVGEEKLKPIKEALPKEVDYFWIKLVKCGSAC